MRKLGITLFLVLCFPVYSFAAPAISFTELSHDFGMVDRGQKLEHVFDFSNKGDQELVIEKVSSS